MNSRELDVLHDGRNKHVLPVGNRVRFGLDRVLKELVDEDWTVRCDINCGSDIFAQHRFIVDNLHAAPAENV